MNSGVRLRKDAFLIVILTLFLALIPVTTALSPDPYFTPGQNHAGQTVISSSPSGTPNYIYIFSYNVSRDITNRGGSGDVFYTVYGDDFSAKSKVFWLESGETVKIWAQMCDSPYYAFSPGLQFVYPSVRAAQAGDADMGDFVIVPSTTPVPPIGPVVPVADFSGTPTSGSPPLTVIFTDNSTGSGISNYRWDFGDGNITSFVYPFGISHRYTSAGTYTINLTVTNASGSSSKRRSGYITVSAPGDQSKAGIYKDGSWYIDLNGDGVWNAGDQNYGFGAPLWTPVNGDWNNDGKTEIGVYREGAWYLDYDASGWWSAGDKNFGYGAAGWTPVVGDWNGGGSDKAGAYKDGAWYLDYDGSGTWNVGDKNFAFGGAGWTPVVGKWTSDGKSKVGVYKDGSYYLDYSGNGAYGAGDKSISYGTAGSTAITGDWNANGLTEVGTQTGRDWKLDYDGLGAVNASTKSSTFGAAGWNPVIGDWNDDGKDKIGIYQNGAWYLDYNGNGIWNAGTDRNFAFGTAGWVPVVGMWG